MAMKAEFSAHFHGERNHQGKGNKLLSLSLAMNPNHPPTRLFVVTGSAVYSNPTAALHE